MNAIFFTALIVALLFTYFLYLLGKEYKSKLKYWQETANKEEKKRREYFDLVHDLRHQQDLSAHEQLVKHSGLYYIEPKNYRENDYVEGVLRFYVHKRTPGYKSGDIIGFRSTEAEARALIKSLKLNQIGVK